MAHFAKLDENNRVLEVHFVSNDDLQNSDYPESEALGITKLTNDTGHSNWKQTSINSNFRDHFAQEGYTYDETNDTFISIKPFESWVYSSTDKAWKPPVSYPNDGNLYIWNETSYQEDNTRGWVVYE